MVTILVRSSMCSFVTSALTASPPRGGWCSRVLLCCVSTVGDRVVPWVTQETHARLRSGHCCLDVFDVCSCLLLMTLLVLAFSSRVHILTFVQRVMSNPRPLRPLRRDESDVLIACVCCLCGPSNLTVHVHVPTCGHRPQKITNALPNFFFLSLSVCGALGARDFCRLAFTAWTSACRRY